MTLKDKGNKVILKKTDGVIISFCLLGTNMLSFLKKISRKDKRENLLSDKKRELQKEIKVKKYVLVNGRKKIKIRNFIKNEKLYCYIFA